MQLWVLIPDLKYSASSIDDGQPRRAMKILYEETRAPQSTLDANDTSIEEFPLPPRILDIIRERLRISNALLPESARSLNNWQVGLLDRFDAPDPSDPAKPCRSDLPELEHLLVASPASPTPT